MPALLHENIRFLINIGIKNGIHIDIHQVLEVLFIAARHRINRLIGIRHGI